MEPIRGLFNSRKFYVLMLDTVVSIITYFVGKYAIPSVADDVLFFIAAIQPVFLALIAGIAAEDSAAKLSGSHPSQYYLKPPLDVPEHDSME